MRKLPIHIEQLSKENIFKVPNGYFEELPDMILSQVKLNLHQKNTQGFKIPNSYFENLSSKILSKINDKQLYSLESLPKTNIFRTPENYFEDLEGRISDKIFVSNLSRENIFNVPDGYFESLPNRINAKINQKQIGGFLKIIRNTKVWAAAASIIILAGLAWFFVPNFGKNEVELALEKASTEEIQSYLNTQDLAYIEYENSTIEEPKTSKTESDSLIFENLKLEEKDILEHIEEQNLDETDLEYILGS